MGHHYYNHMLTGSGSTPPKELEADFFSGYVMAKMGASLEEAKAAMAQIASPMASSTHPAKADRLNAIARGWNSANGATAQTTPRTTEPAPQQSNETPKPVNNDASWIHLSLYSGSNMIVYLSDDGRTFTPASVKSNRPFVFKFEVYDYGWLRFGNNSNAKKYTLYHGKDYAIVWNQRLNNWKIVEV